MFTMLFLALLAQPSFAADEIDLSIPDSFNLIQKNSSFECRIAQMTNYGYVIERGEEETVRITVINDNVNEGDKTAFSAKLMSNTFERAHLQHHRRYQNYGSYIEFVIESSLTAEAGKPLKGKMMMTSAIYTTDIFGTEEEELIPDLAQGIECKRL